MAGRGHGGPRAFPQRVVKTAFLRVPEIDWPAVRQGLKPEFRSSYAALTKTQTPTPVVAWTKRKDGAYEHRLMVLTDVHREPISAISEESLRREGFDSFAEFRRYWIARHRQRFEPGRMVTVYSVRPWTPNDRQEMSEYLFDRIYGEFVEAV